MRRNMESVLACMEAADRFLQEPAVRAELERDAVLSARLKLQAQSLAETVRLVTRREIDILCPACGARLKGGTGGDTLFIDCPNKCDWNQEQWLVIRAAILGQEPR